MVQGAFLLQLAKWQNTRTVVRSILEKLPLKQEGLSSWEILVSESQERMTVAVAPKDKEAFEALARLHEVEATQVATFTDTGYFHVKHGEETVAYLPITFLHDGVPQLELESEWIPPQHESFTPPSDFDQTITSDGDACSTKHRIKGNMGSSIRSRSHRTNRCETLSSVLNEMDQ